MTIHPTAIIHPMANLAADVTVGAWSEIGPEVTLGPGCTVASRVTLEGTVLAGARNTFGHGVIVGSAPQDFAYEPESKTQVRIGDGNTFREYVTIHRGTKDGTETVIGDECFLMVGAHVGHNAVVGNRVVLANNCLLAGHVTLEDGVIGGGGTLFHQFIRVGTLVMTRGGSRYSKDIPPYCTGDMKNTVVGINSIGLRRAGFSPQERMEVRRAFKLLFRSGLNVSQALEAAATQEWTPKAAAFFRFAKDSRRGLCAGSLQADEEDPGGG